MKIDLFVFGGGKVVFWYFKMKMTGDFDQQNASAICSEEA